MSILGVPSTTDIQVDTGIDTNVLNTTTTSLRMDDAQNAGIYVTANTGAHANHVVTLQVSPDNSNWQDTTHTVTGVGNVHDISCIAAWVRAKVTTIEGGASTSDITILIK